MLRDVLRAEQVTSRAWMRNNLGWTQRTGKTHQKTRIRVVKLASGALLRIANNSKVGRWLELGTRPHVISARDPIDSSLRFYWEKVGQVVFFGRVNHPGTRPYRFLRRTARHAFTHLQGRLRLEMSKLARRF